MCKKKLCALSLALLLFVAAVAPQAAAAQTPIAENLELTTYRGVSVGGQLKATAEEGESLTYRITTEPAKGEVVLGEDGRFVYTPAEGKRGRDYFGYRVTDSQGNESQEATVIIRLVKLSGGIRYSDTEGLSCDYAAHAMIERGLFTGVCLAGSYVFEPEHTVTRGEFLAMCMKAAGVSNLSGVQRTGYSDDDAIATWLKPYVSTALLSGYADGSGAFDAEAVIGLNEAAVLVNDIFHVTDVSVDLECFDGGADAASVQATANLSACGVLETGRRSMDEPITRAEAAQMLLRAMDMAEKRA